MNRIRPSGFLNGPGVRCGTAWSLALAWPERVAGAAGPLADLAALASIGLPGIPGPLQLRGRGSRQPPPGAQGPELQVRLAARAAMGVGAALIMPATLAIITSTFTGARERQRATGLWAATSGAGIAPRIFPRCVCANTRRGAFVAAFYSRLERV